MPNHPARFLIRPGLYDQFGDSLPRMGELLRDGDPLADAVAASFDELPRGAGETMLGRALRTGIGSVPDAPPSLRALFEEIDRVPAWVDRDALQRGGDLLLRAGWFGGIALACSLLYGYASPAGNKPLALSGRLDTQAPRRLIETSRFVEATCLPGGLCRSGEGFSIAVRVRVMHAKVRRLIAKSGRWNDDWGLPINQHDMAATSTLFSAAVIDSLRKLGFVFDPEEVHLYMQLWRYSGYLMGVSTEVLPTSEREARRIMDMVALTEGEPDEDSRRLSRALFATGEDPPRATLAEKRRAQRVVKTGQGVIRGVLGRELADRLDVPDHAYRHAFPLVRAAVRAVQAAERRLPPSLRARAHERAKASGRAYWAMLTGAMVGPFEFGLPEALGGSVSGGSRGRPSGVSPLASATRSR